MLPVVVCMVAVVALLAAEHRDWPRARAAAKLSASSAFVWAAIAWGALGSGFGRWMLLGLVLCWLGDALLLPAGQSLWFQLGIGAFLLGHLAYALAFVQLGVGATFLIVGGALVAIFGWRVLRWLGPHVPDGFQSPVRAYVGAISLMLVLALGAVGGGAPAAVGIGAVGFALSDLSVARDRFVSAGFFNAAWGLPAYYLSQLLLAWCSGAVS